MKKQVFEIFLTTNYVDGKEWLKFLLRITQINGLFRKWNLWVSIENNYIRYFIEISRMLPPVLGELGCFLIKRSDVVLNEKSNRGQPYLITSNYNTILDIYDRLGTRGSQRIKKVKFTIFAHKQNSYIGKTYFYVEGIDGKIVKRKAVGIYTIYELISIDFSTHTRFFYQKEQSKYLDTKKVMNILSADKKDAIIKANVFPYLQDELYLSYNNYDFSKHSIVIGASGTGKSKLISAMIKNLYNNYQNKLKYKVVVIDPHAAMEDDIGGLPDTGVIDFKSIETSINLFANASDDIISVTESIMAIFKSIIADRYNPKLERVLRYSIHILLEKRDFNLINLRKLLIEIEYRNKVLREVENYVQPNIIEFFRVDFNELRTKSYQKAISPIIAFIDEIQLIPAMNQTDITSSIQQQIEKNFLTILSLDQMTLGLSITKTIAGFSMQQILQLVQSHIFNEHIILVIDEVAIIENPIISRFLSEARKYNLSLILSGQYFEQISEELQNAIFSNVINYFIFRVSRLDAMLLEKNMQMEVAVRNSIAVRLKMLSELNDRECVVRVGKNGRMLTSFKGETLDFVAVPRRKEIAQRNIRRRVNQHLNSTQCDTAYGKIIPMNNVNRNSSHTNNANRKFSPTNNANMNSSQNNWNQGRVPQANRPVNNNISFNTSTSSSIFNLMKQNSSSRRKVNY